MVLTLLKTGLNGFRLGKGEGIRLNLGLASGSRTLLRIYEFSFGSVGTTRCLLSNSCTGEGPLSLLIVLDVMDLWKNLFYTASGIVAYLDRCGINWEWELLSFSSSRISRVGSTMPWQEIKLLCFLRVCGELGVPENTKCLGGEEVPCHKVVREVRTLAQAISMGYATQNQHTRQDRWATWHSDRTPVHVLNVDSSSLGNPGPAGFGGLLRTHEGEWLVGYYGSIWFLENL